MKVDLISKGAPPLPSGFRYRVHVYEVYETGVDVSVSILEKVSKRLFKILPVKAERVVASSRLHIPKNPNYDVASRRPLVDEAKILYDYAVSRGRIPHP